MSFTNVITLLSGNAVILAGAVWLLKSLIEKTLSAAISHEFETKTIKLKASIAEVEMRLSNSLDKSGRELNEIRAGSMSILAQRQVEYDKRRMEGVDLVWKAIRSLSSSKTIAVCMSHIDLEETAKTIKTNTQQKAGKRSIHPCCKCLMLA